MIKSSSNMSALLFLLLLFLVAQVELREYGDCPVMEFDPNVIVFDAPIITKQVRNFTMKNIGDYRVGFNARPQRLSEGRRDGLKIFPTTGVLNPDQVVVFSVTCDSDSPVHDRINFEWRCPSRGGGHGVAHHVIPVQYRHA
uniref:MSP domain-containing protein n=1 Tax=Steinernema glaseri TaxID=37863 RepID=A0A1I7Y109_9BILA